MFPGTGEFVCLPEKGDGERSRKPIIKHFN